MTAIEINSIIKEITSILVEKYQPDNIILFGSYAYGTPTDDSDVDLLIINYSSAEFD